METVSTKPIVFISYARKDEPEKPARGEVRWRTFVQSYLAPSSLNGIIHIWVDEGIRAGAKWKKEIEAQLKNCDLFILLASNNSLASKDVVNFEIKTIQERQARGENVHIFPIVLDPFSTKSVPWLMELNLRPPSGKALSEFPLQARKKAMVAITDEMVEIAAEIVAEKEKAQTNFLVKDQAAVAENIQNLMVDIAHLPETPYERLVGRETQLKRLDDAWADRNTNILSLIAEGGAGKSALVNEWLKGMRADSYRGAETILGWSFYSQGTKERATSAEQFLNWAIGKLDIEIETTSATAKGEAIAEALMNRGVLLVLDGCEPLQHGLDKQQGELKDLGLRALLRRFAAAPPGSARGLVVLTSRLAIKDIVRWQNCSAPVEPIDELSDEAGAALLRDNGVWGTDKELRAASRDFGGHPLALGLLASFLNEKHVGDARQRDRIRGLLHDEENPRHDHARRVMESYEEEWLAKQPVEHAIMSLIGLFDRPASDECLRALRKKPAIRGLTAMLVGLDEKDWQRAVARLRYARLLVPPDPAAPDALDAHPLVRDWFGQRLSEANKAAFKAAHGRLFEYLRDSTKEGKRPTLGSLAPLYQAIAHGCRAGRHREALNEIYVERICRGVEFYSWRKLGAVGSNLAAISWFFERPYATPFAGWSKDDRSWVLCEAAGCLRGQGRLAEALQTERAGLSLDEAAKNWSDASVSANNMSEGLLLAGETAEAISLAKKAVQLAGRGGNKVDMLYAGVILANSLWVAGRDSEAEARFDEVKKWLRRYKQPPLGPMTGYYLRDHLLAKNDLEAARSSSEVSLSVAVKNKYLGEIGLSANTLGRAYVGLAVFHFNKSDRIRARTNTRVARLQLDNAIESLVASAQMEDLSRGLLTRNIFRRIVGDWNGSARDLEEVEEIAEPGPMKLFLCDMALERARLALARTEAFAPLNGLLENGPPKPSVPDAIEAVGLKEEAATQLTIAADYIKTCGYHRRDEELAELQAVLCGERKFADLPPRV